MTKAFRNAITQYRAASVAQRLIFLYNSSTDLICSASLVVIRLDF
jgi:hypothetical protein